MIYKYTKCESVIAKIMADANMSEKNIRITDIREWIFEAVEKIGAPVQYILRESGADGVPVFHILDYLIPIPDDLESLNAIAFSENPNGPWVNVRSNGQTFKSPKQHGIPHVNVTGPTRDPDNLSTGDPAQMHVAIERSYKHNHVPIIEKVPSHRSQLWGINRSTLVMQYLKEHRTDEPMYFIKPGWIVFNKRDGFAKLSYKAIATDERGYPLIPDMASYQEAIYWYVMMKLSFPKFLTGSLGGKARFSLNTYFYIQQQWNFYRNQAYAESMMPNEGEMSSIKNEWNKLIPDWNSDDTLYENLGKRQLNYNDYYYGY